MSPRLALIPLKKIKRRRKQQRKEDKNVRGKSTIFCTDPNSEIRSCQREKGPEKKKRGRPRLNESGNGDQTIQTQHGNGRTYECEKKGDRPMTKTTDQ